MPGTRVLIADDHPLIIEGLTTSLARHGIEVVAQTTSTTEVLQRFEESEPDVVVLDVRFQEAATGLDVAKELLRKHPHARIIFYSQFDQDEIIREAYRIGGVGFIVKSTAPAILADAIKHVADGRTHFLPEIAERLALIGLRRDDRPQAKLEPRELEVFRYMAQGLTNVEIAETMGLSPKTISMTSQAIKEKLGIHRQAEITRLAVKHKVIDP